MAAHPQIRSTTVLCVRRDGKVTMAADGQVTMGSEVMKSSARKIRPLHDGKVLAGFAGSTADAISLFTRFEEKLQAYGGNLSRAAVELSKDWRMDKTIRHLEALLLVADANATLLLSGTGDVIEPDDNVAAVGIRRRLCRRRGKRPAAAHGSRRSGSGRGRHEDRFRHLHLHQLEHRLRRTGLTPW